MHHLENPGDALSFGRELNPLTKMQKNGTLRLIF